MRHLTFCAALAALGALAVPAAAADDDDIKKQLDELKRQLDEQKARDEARIGELERKLAEKKKPEEQAELQKQIDELVDRLDASEAKLASAKAPATGARTAYIDVSFNALVAGGTSSATNDEIQELQGGHHDPHRRGFTLQNAELVLSGAVDPYFKGAANIVTTVDEDGETVVELEEVYAQTTSLPYGLQVKAGKSFLEFGRQNPQHPHQWEFVDQPVVLTRMFGDDGMNSTGARISWFVPTRFPFEILGGVYNANGNQPSFAGPAEDGPPIGEQVDRGVSSFSDMLFLARADASFDLTDEMPLLVGVSVATGPSGASESGQSSVYGADVTLKWKPLANDHGFPFVAVTAEALARHFGYDSFVDEGGAFVPGGELHDSGAYAQAVWGFRRDWTAGLRYDRANGSDDDVVGMDDRNRWSTALTWYFSEYSKVRLQVNLDDSAALDERATSVWLQFEFNLGQHGAHKF